MSVLKTGIRECALCHKESKVDQIDVIFSERVFPTMTTGDAVWICHDCTAKAIRLGVARMNSLEQCKRPN